MSEPNSLAPQKGETAEKFKERIADTEREIKRETAAQVKAFKESASANAQQAPAQVPAVAPKGEEPQSKSVLKTGNAELDEWLEKKGPMTVENLAHSYRESEREMYRTMEEARKAQGQPVIPPPVVPPANFPPYYPAPVPQQWGPPAYNPQPQINPQANIEALAKQYGLSPEDFEKVAPLVNDMARSVVDSTLQRVLPPIMNQVNGVNREVGRQKELVDLMSDPVFKTPQVQFEMDRIFKEEPNIFVAQAHPLRYAFEKALMRRGRDNLGGSTGQPAQIVPGVVPSSSKPPAMAGGNGNGGGGAPSGTPQDMTPEVFAGLSMAEKMAHLNAIGVRPH